MDSNVLIVPESGKEAETLRLLLDLADRARHVKTSSDDGGYYVPEYLAEKYQQAATEQPAPKRRGRPPGSRTKAVVAADDQEGEE